MNIVAYTAMIRPRSRSGTRFCKVVFVAAICTVAQNPTTESTAIESQNTFDCEKITKATAQVVEVAAIHLANPL